MPCTVLSPGETEASMTTLPTPVTLNIPIWGHRKGVDINGLSWIIKIKQGKVLKYYREQGYK